MSMYVTIFSLPLGDIAAAFALVFGIPGVIYLTARYGWRYSAPVLLPIGVALCCLTLDMASHPNILTQIGQVIIVLAVVAGLLLIVLGDIALWRMFAAPPPPKDYPPLFASVILPTIALIPMHEADNATGFFLLATLALLVAGLLAPVSITFFQVMRAKRVAKRARPTP